VTDRFLDLQTSDTIRRAAAQLRPLVLNLEITDACGGSCSYCLSASASDNRSHMSMETVKEVIADAKALGVRHITLPGGDPLLHPRFHDIMEWIGTEVQLHSFIVTSAIISTSKAQMIADLARRGYIHMVGIHIDTIDPDVYARIHLRPDTLQLKLRGYQNLLDAGFPPSNVVACICLTSESVKTAEQTMDWFHEKQVGWINLLEHRAKLRGSEWLRIGTMECSKFFCKTTLFVTYDGYVMPCAFFRETRYGNVFDERLIDIFNRHKHALLYDFEVEGPCGSCANSDVCFGCRSTAQTYVGNPAASDPKCWRNPDAPELMYR
jgi:radical SAM protein with 4Fe4S-binding SPASM domain